MTAPYLKTRTRAKRWLVFTPNAVRRAVRYCEVMGTRPNTNRSILGGVLVAVVFAGAGVRVQAGADPRSIPAVRARTPPVIDGKLDDACWTRAPVATGFTEHRGEQPASEQTIVRVLYDDTNIFVAFECIEPEPDRILATERKYDRELSRDDFVEIQFDTFHDHRSRYIFVVNPLGTRYDARRGFFGTNEAWDCDWSAACTIEKDRWIAEMAIPIGELHFQRGTDVTWGVNFHRQELGIEEESTWSYHTENTFSPQWFGELTGLDLSTAPVDRKPRFETYVSGTARAKDGGSKIQTGLDVSLRLSPQLISAFTLNPDFGQVEADADTITLRDTERFLDERRPFFSEGAELFRTPIRVYYSRRIWDIDAGAKITGVGSKWNMGLIDVEGEIARGEGNFLIGRLTRNVGENSHVGAIFTSSERHNGYNRVGGFDTEIQLTDTSEWTSQILGMVDQEAVISIDERGYETTETVRRDAYALTTRLEGGRRPFYWYVDLKDISEDFEPDLGFITWPDIRGGTGSVELWDEFPEGPIKWYWLQCNATVYEDHEGDTWIRDNWQWFGLGFRNDFEFVIIRKEDFHRPYNNKETTLNLTFNADDYWRSFGFTYGRGVFQEVPYDLFIWRKPFKIGGRFTSTFSGTYRIERPDEGDRAVWLWRSVSEYTFPWDARVKFTFEQTSEERHNATLLFSWLPREDWDLYVVLTDSQTEDLEERGVFAKVVRRF